MHANALVNHTGDFHKVHQLLWALVSNAKTLESFDELCLPLLTHIRTKEENGSDDFWLATYQDIRLCIAEISRVWQASNPELCASDFAAKQLALYVQALKNPTLDWNSRRRFLTSVQIFEIMTRPENQKRIPKIIHLLKTDNDSEHINPINFLSIKSIIKNNPDYRVLLHTAVQPKGELWEQLLPSLKVNLEVTPQKLGDERLSIAAHQADVWRVQKLIQFGGFYFDWDMILLKPVDELRENVCVMGIEKTPSGHNEALGVSAIGAQANSVFLKCWISMMAEAFDPTNYLVHSVILAKEIATALPIGVNVLPAKSFYHPGWTEADMDWMFEPKHKVTAAELVKTYQDSWGVHFFESNASFLKHADKVVLCTPAKPTNNFEELMLMAGL